MNTPLLGRSTGRSSWRASTHRPRCSRASVRVAALLASSTGTLCLIVGDAYYAISGDENPPPLKSTDLKTWTYVGYFLRHQLPGVTIGEDISCPKCFRIGKKWLLLCISQMVGCRYYLGAWDAEAEQFILEKHGRMNWRWDDQRIWGPTVARRLFCARERMHARWPPRHRFPSTTCQLAKMGCCGSSSTKNRSLISVRSAVFTAPQWRARLRWSDGSGSMRNLY